MLVLYFNTNDMVRVNGDGSMTCIGRSNQFFVNNAGVRFDAGLVQNAVTSQPGMEGFMPKMPVMSPIPPMPMMKKLNEKWNEQKNDEGTKVRKEDFKSGVMTFWEQVIEMQKSTVEASRDQWNQFFKHSMDMQETFASVLPDETPSLFGLPAVSPKEFMKKMKEFQELSNTHFVEQADSVVDFCFKGKEQIRDMVSTAMEENKKEEAAEAVDDEASVE